MTRPTSEEGVIQEHGIVVTVARTGPEGLLEATRHPYDVVLLDHVG